MSGPLNSRAALQWVERAGAWIDDPPPFDSADWYTEVRSSLETTIRWLTGRNDGWVHGEWQLTDRGAPFGDMDEVDAVKVLTDAEKRLEAWQEFPSTQALVLKTTPDTVVQRALYDALRFAVTEFGRIRDEKRDAGSLATPEKVGGIKAWEETEDESASGAVSLWDNDYDYDTREVLRLRCVKRALAGLTPDHRDVAAVRERSPFMGSQAVATYLRIPKEDVTLLWKEIRAAVEAEMARGDGLLGWRIPEGR